MTRRERVLAAIAHTQPDKTPWEIGLTIPAADKLAAVVGLKPEELDEWIGNHLYHVPTERDDSWQEIKPGYWRDQFGVIWNRTVDPDIGVIEDYQLDARSLKDYTFPNPDDPRLWETFAARLTEKKDRFSVCSIGFSLFERAWTLRGMTNLLIDMIEAPQFVDELLNAICEHNLRLVEQAVKFDIDAVYFGDDWGQQHGLIMGPHLWRRFIQPCIARMYSAVKRHGKKVIIHSCGDVDELFPELIAAGLDVFNPFQPEVMDINQVKLQFGDKLTFLGGMSIQRIMPYGTVAEVKTEAHRLIREIGANGGYIIAPSHAIPKDVPVENILALIEVARDEQA